MAANSNTALEPAVAYKVATDHRQTADDISRQKDAFSDAVDLMDDACDGDMIKALRDSRDRWVQEVNEVVRNLEAMAGNVESASKDIETRDQDNADPIGRIGLDILRDI